MTARVLATLALGIATAAVSALTVLATAELAWQIGLLG